MKRIGYILLLILGVTAVFAVVSYSAGRGFAAGGGDVRMLSDQHTVTIGDNSPSAVGIDLGRGASVTNNNQGNGRNRADDAACFGVFMLGVFFAIAFIVSRMGGGSAENYYY